MKVRVMETRQLVDNHDCWKIEVVDDINRGTSIDRIHSLTTRLRIKHEVLGCYLRAVNAVLPQWCFKQIEVSCDRENNPKDAHTYWNVESHRNDRCRTCLTVDSPDNLPFFADSTRWQSQVLQFTFLPQLLAPQYVCGWGDTQIKVLPNGNATRLVD
ncbi:hypothetical protein BYT27DRAFT_7204521 [Phlegmacium glaucopus]|nr:hypothetical protein BYT27DRAFT_7204521 [Phlegmacium glaucopus]